MTSHRANIYFSELQQHRRTGRRYNPNRFQDIRHVRVVQVIIHDMAR